MGGTPELTRLNQENTGYYLVYSSPRAAPGTTAADRSKTSRGGVNASPGGQLESLTSRIAPFLSQLLPCEVAMRSKSLPALLRQGLRRISRAAKKQGPCRVQKIDQSSELTNRSLSPLRRPRRAPKDSKGRAFLKRFKADPRTDAEKCSASQSVVCSACSLLTAGFD